jgi:hypothetical protein
MFKFIRTAIWVVRQRIDQGTASIAGPYVIADLVGEWHTDVFVTGWTFLLHRVFQSRGETTTRIEGNSRRGRLRRPPS